MSMYQIYFSPTNNTKNIVKIIGSILGEASEIDLTDRSISVDNEFSSEDICIFGVPSYGGRVPETAIKRMENYRGNGARAILVVSYGNRDYEDTLRELQDVLKKRGFRCVAGIAAIAEHSIMHQFATGRPDEDDKKELVEFAKKIKEILQKDEDKESVEFKNKGLYREYHGVPLKPKVNKNCKNCGMCASLCPVGAIPANNPKETDFNLCISCMRCVEQCPSHARKVSSLKLKVASIKMKKSCLERKNNEIFL